MTMEEILKKIKKDLAEEFKEAGVKEVKTKMLCMEQIKIANYVIYKIPCDIITADNEFNVDMVVFVDGANTTIKPIEYGEDEDELKQLPLDALLIKYIIDNPDNVLDFDGWY